MHSEIARAAAFVTVLCKHDLPNETAAQRFRSALIQLLTQRISGHWFEESPVRGQAFRCIHYHAPRSVDAVVAQAAREANVTLTHVPREWTVWIDPDEVAARLGETGDIVTLNLLATTAEAITAEDSSLLSTLLQQATTSASGSSSPTTFPTSPSLTSFGGSTSPPASASATTTTGSTTGSSTSSSGYSVSKSLSPRTQRNHALVIMDPVTLQVAT
jgi:protein Tob/BTG